jgi:hypothetical protein
MALAVLRLRIRRTAGDRIGEASTLNNIGLTYASQSGQQKASCSYKERAISSFMISLVPA